MTFTSRSTRPTSVLARWRQFSASLRCRPDPHTDGQLRRLLNDDGQWGLVARLPAFDRRHVLEVHTRLVESGYTDPDLLRAALLHDIGKAGERGRVGTPHRVVRVLLRRVHPELVGRIAARLSTSNGLYLAEHHATLGAEIARNAGVSARCCWLIEQHERCIESVSDPLLLALIAADEGKPIP
jgi:putative nucleotidyltransferase with HDIG domain